MEFPRRQKDWVLCSNNRNITSFPIQNGSFSFFRAWILKIGNNTLDNGKLVIFSSLNHFHVQTFYQINKFVGFSRATEEQDKKGSQKC